jgi:putative flippase GtrA
MSGQFPKFLVTGGIAALINLISRYLLSRAIGFETAVVIAYLTGMITAYVLARQFVFEASGRTAGSEFYRFAVVNMFALVLVWCISVGLARVAFPAVGFRWHAYDIAHLIGVLAPAVTSYFGHRFYTFAKQAA